MAERIFSIDFGSAYTKVALRRDPTATGDLIACSGAEFDYWIPSVLAVDRRSAEPRIEFGDRAAELRPGGGIDVYTNFKKDLFSDSPDLSGSTDTPLDALFRSDEFALLAVKHSVSRGQVAELRKLAGTAKALLGLTDDQTTSAIAKKRETAFKLACHFFHFLRRNVLDACARLSVTGLKFEEIPVRVAVPAFATGAAAENTSRKLLNEALHRAGWPPHPEVPMVTEPEANAIGILTKGTNLLTRSGRINLGDMLSKGPLNTVLKSDPHHPSYQALVIDVGAYTTDFASLYVNTNGKPWAPDFGAGFTINSHSVPLGATDLENTLPALLSSSKREWLEKAPRKEFAAVQRNIFSDTKGYRVPELGVIGGEADREAIATCLSDFTRRLTTEVRQFCSGLEKASMQELILTGGGSTIPAVRDALISAVQSQLAPFARIHASDLKRTKAGPPVDKLSELHARGGSALGASSIYFEKCYY